MNNRLLLIDDDEAFVGLLAKGLERAGFKITSAFDGRAGLELASTNEYELVILDVRLPLMGGIDVCTTLRAHSMVPILMLSGEGDDVDLIVTALEVGADDYMAKPFRLAELVARVKALLRRAEPRAGEGILHAGPLAIDVSCHTVHKDGTQISLSRTEFELLVELARSPSRPLTRGELLEKVWHYSYLGASRLVDMAVRRLRERVEDEPKKPRLIATVRGVGYRLNTSPSGLEEYLLVLHLERSVPTLMELILSRMDGGPAERRLPRHTRSSSQ